MKWEQVVFFGLFEHAIDAKNRLIIPRKLREVVDEAKEGAGFYLTKGFEDCLVMYTPAQWDKTSEVIRGGNPLGRANARHFHRLFFAYAERVTCDKQGRILLPERLKKVAGLQRDVIITGVDERIEIWDAQKFRAYEHTHSPNFDKFVEGLL